MTHRGALADVLARNGAEVIAPPVKRQPSLHGLFKRMGLIAVVAADLLLVMLRRKPGIVHCFLPSAYLVGAPLAALSGCKIRVMSRRSLNRYQRTRKVFGVLELFIHRLVTAALGNSHAVVEELKDEGIPSERIGLIYNGIDVKLYEPTESREAIRKRLDIDPDELVIITVANLIPYKGHREFLKGLDLAKSKFPHRWRALIVGRDDGIGAELKALAKGLRLSGNVKFLGLRNDVPDLLKASDIGALCSHQEGFANAILEGMAARLPMIVTNVGGNAEAVVHEKTGLVVAPGHPQAFADALQRLAQDPLLRASMGEAGFERVSENFRLDKSVAAYDHFYRGLIGSKVPRDIPSIAVVD